jgi:hypothetical protein
VIRAVLATVVLAFAFSGAVADTITVCASGCQYTSINAAIAAANDGDIIQLSDGTYTEGAVIDTLGKAITLRGAVDKSGAALSILDGGNLHGVLKCISGEDDTTVFENLVIQNGSAAYGGGMYNGSSSPTLTNCTFTENTANYGGGMYNSNSSPTLTGCTFEGNSASYGGGMLNDYDGSPTLSGCTFTGNSAYDGGGMYNENSSPTLTGCTFTENTANYGGGGMVNSNSSPTLEDCTFEGNSASAGGAGGGMYNSNNSSPTLTNTILCGNTPEQVYGAFTDNGGNCIQESCADCEDCTGDFNSDGEVNGQDLGVFLVEWGQCADCAADFNGDGFVDGIDLGLFLVAWGPCP